MDCAAVIDTAQRAGTILEINAIPAWLDIYEVSIRKCVGPLAPQGSYHEGSQEVSVNN